MLAALDLDRQLVTELNAGSRRSEWLRQAVAIAAQGLAPVEVALMLTLAARGRPGRAIRMLMAVSAVYVACEALGRLWPRERPFAAESGVVALIEHDAERSFPSRHVASGLAMASIGGGAPGQLMALVAWALGASRVAAGLHYPSDVLGGAALGLTVGYILRS